MDDDIKITPGKKPDREREEAREWARAMVEEARRISISMRWDDIAQKARDEITERLRQDLSRIERERSKWNRLRWIINDLKNRFRYYYIRHVVRDRFRAFFALARWKETRTNT